MLLPGTHSANHHNNWRTSHPFRPAVETIKFLRLVNFKQSWMAVSTTLIPLHFLNFLQKDARQSDGIEAEGIPPVQVNARPNPLKQ